MVTVQWSTDQATAGSLYAGNGTEKVRPGPSYKTSIAVLTSTGQPSLPLVCQLCHSIRERHRSLR